MDKILIQRWMDAFLVVFKEICKGKKKTGADFLTTPPCSRVQSQV